MRFSDDNDKAGLSPAIVTAIIAVTMMVGIIVLVVLIANKSSDSKQNNSRENAQVSADTNVPELPAETSVDMSGYVQPGNNAQQENSDLQSQYPDIADVITGSTLKPEDLDFWDKYPKGF